VLGRAADPVWSAASRADGLLLPAARLDLTQLRTRRPLLLDPSALDGLAYAMTAAPATARILRDVYGVDFFDPPPESRRRGSLAEDTSRALWEARSTAEWSDVRRTWGVSHVVTPPGWRLSLAKVAEGEAGVLYAVPAGD
jgi:hypothetical protein